MILKSRPIRGAENCPMRVPSRALHSFLKEMLSDFRNIFPESIPFPVLGGCDDFLKRLSHIKLTKEDFTMTTLISADFSDAFTETSIPRLTNSISMIGRLLGYEDDHIEIMKSLVELVFLNSYFYTPYGLYRQNRGMPMGDFSSRESLDVVLSNCEFEILKISLSLDMNFKLYVRLVDDISVVIQNNFSSTIDFIQLMVKHYPNMPLNFQLSFGYSRFLDLHLYNIMDDFEKPDYQITHTLAYKEHSSFSYTPQYSNIHSKYKHAAVPIYMYRIHTRCNRNEDINNHLSFILKMLRNRDPNDEIVRKKFKQFFTKRTDLKKGTKKNEHKPDLDIKTTTILYDEVSLRHIYMKKLISYSFSNRLRVLYKSRPKLLCVICPKRLVIKILSRNRSFLES